MSERSNRKRLINNWIEISRSELSRSREWWRQLRRSTPKKRVSKMKSRMCKAVVNKMQLQASRGNMTLIHKSQLRRRKKRKSH